ncbi:hypothetical protein F4679DRAFT_85055 [Xylaria curta]|nr:hypothetical protein F4679DRAFT_85055 [Xylaria curta]
MYVCAITTTAVVLVLVLVSWSPRLLVLALFTRELPLSCVTSDIRYPGRYTVCLLLAYSTARTDRRTTLTTTRRDAQTHAAASAHTLLLNLHLRLSASYRRTVNALEGCLSSLAAPIGS